MAQRVTRTYRLDDGEWAAVCAVAALAGVPPSTWVRKVVVEVAVRALAVPAAPEVQGQKNEPEATPDPAVQTAHNAAVTRSRGVGRPGF